MQRRQRSAWLFMQTLIIDVSKRFFWYASAFIFTFSCETRVTFFSLGVLADTDARARRLGVKRCSDHLRSKGFFRIRRFFHGCMKKNWTPVLHWHAAVCGAVLPQNAYRWLVEVACGFGVTSPQVRPALGSNMNAVDGLCPPLVSFWEVTQLWPHQHLVNGTQEEDHRKSSPSFVRLVG